MAGESMQRILSGEPLPLYPANQGPELDKYFRELHDYLRRLTGKFSEANLQAALSLGQIYSITRTFEHYYVSPDPAGWGDGNPAMVYGNVVGASANAWINVPYAGTVVGLTVNWLAVGYHVAGNMYFRIHNLNGHGTDLETIALASEVEAEVTGGTLSVAVNDGLYLEVKSASPGYVHSIAVVSVLIKVDDHL